MTGAFLAITALAGVASQSSPPPEAGAREEELAILDRLVSATMASTDQFRCDGLSNELAIERAERRLGRTFRPRLAAVNRALEARWGAPSVEQVRILIGHHITPRYCERIGNAVARARRALSDLEGRLGIPY